MYGDLKIERKIIFLLPLVKTRLPSKLLVINLVSSQQCLMYYKKRDLVTDKY